MSIYNLTTEQKTALKAAVGRFKGRPDWHDYDLVTKQLRVIGPKSIRASQARNAINTHQPNAFGGKWVKPTIIPKPGFDETDLPAGVAAYSIVDSAGTHALDNAAVVMWRELWNAWALKDKPPVSTAASRVWAVFKEF